MTKLSILNQILNQMNMKKLLTFLFALSISVASFGTARTWTGAVNTDWTNGGNWSPAGAPSSGTGEELYFILTSNVTVINIPTITLDHLYVTSDGLDYWTLTFNAATDGNTITFEKSIVTVHLNDVKVGALATLKCNEVGARVKVVCKPGIRFLVEGNTGDAAGIGFFYPAIYEPCTGGKGFVLQADATSHAEFIQQTNAINVVRGWQEYYLPVSKFHYISLPVKTDNVGINPGAAPAYACRKANCLCFLTGNYVRNYVWASQDWGAWLGNYTDCFDTDLDFTFGKGYEVYSVANKSEVYGDFNTNGTTTNLAVIAGAGSANKWNLIGNPYPSGVKFTSNDGSNLVGWSWVLSQVSPWVCYWNSATSETYYYKWDTKTAVPPRANADVIPRGQGFFVYKLTNPGSVGVYNDARNFHGDVGIGKESEEIGTNQLYLKLSDGVNSPDWAVIKFDQKQGSIDYGVGDMMKYFENNPEKSEIYCTKGDGSNVIMTTLTPSGNTSVPVYMSVGKTGTYTITAEQINTFGSNAGILLKDTKTNTTIDLRTTDSYTFDAAAGDDAGRFILFFTDVLGINKLTDNSFKVYSSGNSIYIQNSKLNEQGTVTVYDMVGKELMNVNLSSDFLTKLNTSFVNGYYIVSIKTDKGLLTEKVYLN